MNAPSSRQRGSKDLWLNAAYEMLIPEGIGAAKVMSLAKQLNLARTGFYWFFEDIAEPPKRQFSCWSLVLSQPHMAGVISCLVAA